MKIIFILLIFITSLFSHPHTFIDVYPTIKTEDSSNTTLHFKWVLDDMTSTILIMELDKDGDGKINEKENSFIYEVYFSLFRDYSYYTYIRVNGKDVKLPEPKNFRATIENSKICYSFDIELKHDIKNTIIEFGDSDFYVAMVLKDEFVSADGLNVKVTDVDNDFYYGFRLEFK